MICQPCRQAADQQLGRDAHCDDPKCMCGHRVDRYRPLPEEDDTPEVEVWANALGKILRAYMPDDNAPKSICFCGGVRFAGQPIHNAGCLWKNDLAPLRELAGQALAEPADPPGAAPTCTATLDSPFGAGIVHCTRPAGHHNPVPAPTFGADSWATDPGGWHWSGPRTAVWTDSADGATPHTDATED